MAKIKKIRFPLEMENGVMVRTIEELKDNFSLEKILMYISNGKLLTWLRDRYLEDIADTILALNQNDEEYEKKICGIFGVEYDEKSNIDLEDAIEKQRRIALLKEYTDDEEYYEYVDQMAFDQDEIDALLDEGVTTIYLCGNSFHIPISKKGVRYIGVNAPVVVINSKQKVNFEEREIFFENIEFDEKYQSILVEYKMQGVKAKIAFNEYIEDTYLKAILTEIEQKDAEQCYTEIAKCLENLNYDANADINDLKVYLADTGIEDWGTDYFVNGEDTLSIRKYLSNSGFENWGMNYLEHA